MLTTRPDSDISFSGGAELQPSKVAIRIRPSPGSRVITTSRRRSRSGCESAFEMSTSAHANLRIDATKVQHFFRNRRNAFGAGARGRSPEGNPPVFTSTATIAQVIGADFHAKIKMLLFPPTGAPGRSLPESAASPFFKKDSRGNWAVCTISTFLHVTRH